MSTAEKGGEGLIFRRIRYMGIKCEWMECLILTSKNLAKLKQYCYFHAEVLEEIQ